jgi:hypothetical protein
MKWFDRILPNAALRFAVETVEIDGRQLADANGSGFIHVSNFQKPSPKPHPYERLPRQ